MRDACVIPVNKICPGTAIFAALWLAANFAVPKNRSCADRVGSGCGIWKTSCRINTFPSLPMLITCWLYFCVHTCAEDWWLENLVVLQRSHHAAWPGVMWNDSTGGDTFCQGLMERAAAAAGDLHNRKPPLSMVQNFQASSVGRCVALIQTHVVTARAWSWEHYGFVEDWCYMGTSAVFKNWVRNRWVAPSTSSG